MVRKRTKKPVSKSAPVKPPVETKVEFTPDRRLSLTLGVAAEYGQVKSVLTLSENLKEDDDVLEKVDELNELLSDKAIEKFDELAEKFGFTGEAEEEEEDQDEPEMEEESDEDEEWEEEDSDEDGEDEDEDEDEEDGDGDEEDDEDLTEEEILKMKKAELLELIEEEDLDVDPKGMKIKELREAVCDAYFGDEDEEDDEEESDDEEWDDEEWEDEDED